MLPLLTLGTGAAAYIYLRTASKRVPHRSQRPAAPLAHSIGEPGCPRQAARGGGGRRAGVAARDGAGRVALAAPGPGHAGQRMQPVRALQCRVGRARQPRQCGRQRDPARAPAGGGHGAGPGRPRQRTLPRARRGARLRPGRRQVVVFFTPAGELVTAERSRRGWELRAVALPERQAASEGGAPGGPAALQRRGARA